MSVGLKARAEACARGRKRLTWAPIDGGSYAIDDTDELLLLDAPFSTSENNSMLYVMCLNTGRMFHRQGTGTKLRGRPISQMVHQTWLRSVIAQIPRAADLLREGDVSGAGEVDRTNTNRRKRMALINVTKRRTVTVENSLELGDNVIRKLLQDAGQDVPRNARVHALAIDGQEVEIILPIRLSWVEKTTEEDS